MTHQRITPPLFDAGWWQPARRVPSPNFGPRPPNTPIELLLVHSISLPPGEYGGPYIDQFFTNHLSAHEHPYFATIATLQVSAHFVIDRKGLATQYVSVDDRAWHAGRSQWMGRDNCNDWSVGVELEGLEGDTFTTEQYTTLSQLTHDLAGAYPIRHVAGHSHVAPGRKADPGPGFDWSLMHQKTASLSLSYPPELLA